MVMKLIILSYSYDLKIKLLYIINDYMVNKVYTRTYSNLSKNNIFWIYVDKGEGGLLFENQKLIFNEGNME